MRGRSLAVAAVLGGLLLLGAACASRPDPGGSLLPAREGAPTPDRCRAAVKNSRNLAGLYGHDPVAERQEVGRCVQEGTAAQVECAIRARSLIDLEECEGLGRR